MTPTSAFWRLFPAALFTFLGLAWCFFWRSDAALFAIAMCLAALATSWLVISIIVVAKTLNFAPAASPVEGASASKIAS